jgi:IS5 family transposase
LKFPHDLRSRHTWLKIWSDPVGIAIDAGTTQHVGYAISERKRKRIEECFGWLKTIALLRKIRHRGIFKVGWAFTFAAAAYNLVRMRNLAIQRT